MIRLPWPTPCAPERGRTGHGTGITGTHCAGAGTGSGAGSSCATLESPALDPGSTLPDASPPSPSAAGWRAALTFFAVLIALALPDLLAQGASRTAGLAWSELSTMLLPALVATAGSNLRVVPYLGLGRPRPPLVAMGAALGALGFVAANGVMALWTMALPRHLLELFDVARIFEGTALTRAVVSVVAALVAPFCEEVAFRGFLQRTALRGLRPAAAIALSSVLFGTRHLDPVRFPAVVALGALFGWLAWRGGSLWPAVAAHAANNVLATGLAIAGDAGTEVPARPTLWEALVPLVVGVAATVGLAAAFHRMAPPLPPAPPEVPRRDPTDPSTRFRAHLVPTPLVAAAAAAAVSLFALLLTAAL